MEKIKINALLQAAAAALVVLILLLSAEEAECRSTVGAPAFNVTGVGDWLDDGGEEFLMESETSRRILQAGGKNTINYRPLKPELPFCDSVVYGSCIGKDSKTYTKRNCGYHNSCFRLGS